MFTDQNNAILLKYETFYRVFVRKLDSERRQTHLHCFYLQHGARNLTQSVNYSFVSY